MISTTMKENVGGGGDVNASRPDSVVQDSFRQQKMIKQFAQTLIFIVLIFVASFFRDIIKQERIRKKERAELAAQIARQNYLLEQEKFAEKHRDFLNTFLEYEDHCNKIHALLYKNPGEFDKVNDNNYSSYCHSRRHCKSGNHRKLPVRIQMGDRTPLDFALIYVFLASLMFLLVRAIIDVSKEFNNASENDSNEKSSSLHDYASSTTTTTTRRCSNATQTPSKTKRGSKFSRVSVSVPSEPTPEQSTEPTSISKTDTCAIDKSKTGVDRRLSVPVTMAHHLLKEPIEHRRQSESFSEEDEHADGKKHRLIRR